MRIRAQVRARVPVRLPAHARRAEESKPDTAYSISTVCGAADKTSYNTFALYLF